MKIRYRLILPTAFLGMAALFFGCDRQAGSIGLAEMSVGKGAAQAGPGSADAEYHGLPETVTFNAHIRPILSNSCFSCHGFDPETREAGFRLDTPEGAYSLLRGSDTDRGIVPGDPERSEVYARITSDDPQEQMPPPTFHLDPLDDREVALIRRWIEQGAEYEEHWSFEPVIRYDPPEPAKYHDDVANPIDAFVLARLEAEGVEPSPLADRATLLRRLSLDLTGLPPTPDELAAFVADEREDAYERQVERLLASPRYGERMAVSWLDVARYADSAGFHGDQTTRIFPYRDYVIDAFNSNKPFDQFTIEQLAGDLLPDATEEQHIATGFLRLNMMTREGGAQPDEYIAKYMGDRLRALGGAWLGLTIGCAECHDHKFDPITAKDYYSLGAFFADIRQWGVYSHYSNQPNPELAGRGNNAPFPPEILTKSPALLARIDMLQGRVVDVLAPVGKEEVGEDELRSWSVFAADFLGEHPDGWAALEPENVTVPDENEFLIREDGSVVITGDPQEEGVVELHLPLPDAPVRSIRFEALPDELNDGLIGRADDGRFVVTPTFAIHGTDEAELEIDWAQADRRSAQRFTTDGQLPPVLEKAWHSGPDRLEFPLDAATYPHHAVYHLKQPLPAAAGRVLVVKLETEDLGRARFSVTPFGGAIPGHAMAVRSELADALAKNEGARSADDRREIAAAHILATRPESELPSAFATLRDSIRECRAGYAHSMVAEALPEDEIPPVHYLPRGEWMNPGDEVQPALPEFLPGGHPDVDRRLNRLDLAHWLLAPDNPLPSRHFMNRMWQQFFGRGLSGLVDDLGSQGEMPTHPELLDWLASEFRESGWDVKHMVRLIVTSHTYRREAATREELLETDPENLLLAGQAARRLDAEFIRDNALAISGLLEGGVIGGPSIRPYQPEGYYDNLNFPIRDYHESLGDEQHRRGLYMHWQRTFLHPMLAAFDAPSREECVAERFQANSPQQALVLLNDPTFVEAARAFARRVLDEKPAAGDGERIRHGIRLALAREPRDGEVESLAEMLESQRGIYQGNAGDARALLRTGHTGSRFDSLPDDEASELAAWTQLCRVLLNLHETITRY